ncbi:30S ribosomal protein S3 [candidate division WS6 bacterium RIFOXYC1_FULL_33_10]|uniref:Small ribosomal subunit protein uS3 n=2 Tax=Candidatus Dojkabacteria TaxID=74243 RepID=A0A1F4UI99_9BACT|nr:ribosomal protein S3 [uncultured bacterium]OGC44159.1 MAG: 30S ribosomal protein S3 [candidate division WS6 bacterium RIFOXYC1_FULL_33_10]OGC44705.1 MAG: 30S ribosomal protein S3 [candidate division WS6 bacterium RIFOXYB1_FULL_33_14]
MGRKVNANAIRMGINKTWNSVWYTSKREYPAMLAQDLEVKKLVTARMKDSGIDKILINRTAHKIEVELYVARPGVAIGRGGEGIDILQKDLKKMTKSDVEVKIKEVRKADLSARIIARSIADGIERRQPSKLLAASAKEKAMMAGAKGIKIWISGRINNASQARTVKQGDGSVPAQTLRADIDYAEETAKTLDAGLMGVKVWIYKGEKNNIEDEN